MQFTIAVYKICIMLQERDKNIYLIRGSHELLQKEYAVVFMLTCIAEQYSRVVGQACLALNQLVQIATTQTEQSVKQTQLHRKQKTHAGIM